MGHLIADAKAALDDLGHARTRPDGAAKAKRFGTLTEERRQLRALLGSQTGGSSSGFVACQGGDTTEAGAGEPCADGALGDAQGRGNPLLRPALLMESQARRRRPSH